MFGSSGVLGGFNADVLNAQPENDEAKVRLIEEIKNRAKGCIASKNFPEAVSLYSKAIEVCPANDPAAKAILFANRSMCNLSMSKAGDAVEDAQQAVTLDPSYIKGWYRLGSAHQQKSAYTLALQAFEEGLKRKPDDKELLTQVDKVKQKMKTTPSSSSSSSSTTTTTTTATTQKAAAVKSDNNGKSNGKATASSAAAADAGEMDVEEEAGEKFRGYRKTADGRVTTFFNRDLDEQTKQLIGDIAPKKLEESNVSVVEGASKGGGSVWNTAGTYEERDLTPWAKQRLTSLFSEIGLVHPSPATLHMGEDEEGAGGGVVDLTGSAGVTLNRGKKKHFADFSVTLSFTVTIHPTADETHVVRATLPLFDISADGSVEFGELVVKSVDGANPPAASYRALPAALQPSVQALVVSSNSLLKKKVEEIVALFCQELKEK